MLAIRAPVFLLVVNWAATAASFTVNSTADLPDAVAGNGVCATGRVTPAGQPECTLRAAIDEANALAGADEILIPAGTYTYPYQQSVVTRITAILIPSPPRPAHSVLRARPRSRVLVPGPRSLTDWLWNASFSSAMAPP
jgi:CSLREA domain-containing protein